MNTETIVIEQTYNASIETVWNAITDEDQMRKWFFEQMTEFQPEVGFETEFNVHHEGTDYLHQWKVTEVVPMRRISYTWSYGGFPGDSLVTWELSGASAGTKLLFTHTGRETIQGDPIFSRENCEAGWKYFIHESLKAFLDQTSA